MTWTPAEPVPGEIVPHLDACVATARDMLKPADKQAWAVSMDRLLSWVERYGVIPLPTNDKARAERLQDIALGYREDLPDIPGDLLYEAVNRIIGEQHYRVLPMPGDIRKAVKTEWDERKRRLDKLQTARFMNTYRPQVQEPAGPRRKPTPEEIALVSKLKDEAVRHLTSAA
nr:hypothetical protein 29 [Balneolaceae bacterium]